MEDSQPFCCQIQSHFVLFGFKDLIIWCSLQASLFVLDLMFANIRLYTTCELLMFVFAKDRVLHQLLLELKILV